MFFFDCEYKVCKIIKIIVVFWLEYLLDVFYLFYDFEKWLYWFIFVKKKFENDIMRIRCFEVDFEFLFLILFF